MSTFQPRNISYGLSQPLLTNAPSPIVAKRDPLTSDLMAIGTIWCNTTTNSVFILASITNNTANWESTSGGAGVFGSLTVTPGPISLTGATSINTAGAATTTIGTGGTGLVSIGNATGTSVNGPLTVTGTALINTTGTAATHIGNATGNTFIDAGNLTVTAGNVIITNDNLTFQAADTGPVFSNGITIVTGTGDPNGVVAAIKGSLYLNLTGSGVANRAFINTTGAMVWTAITTVA